MTGALAGRVAIISGASRGIGAHVARRFAAEGAAVAVVGRSASETNLPGTIHDTAESVEAAGGTAVAIRADIRSPDDRVRVVEQARAELGAVDILVNNAAAIRLGPVTRLEDRKIALMFDVMVHGPLALCRLVVPDMVDRGEGWIVNVTSKNARHPAGPPYPAWAQNGSVIYGMAKAALDRLTTGLAAELYGTGVRVNGLGPSGMVLTPGSTASGYAPNPEVLVEDPAVLPEAAVQLCSGPPELTGLVVFSEEFLGARETSSAWSLAATYQAGTNPAGAGRP